MPFFSFPSLSSSSERPCILPPPYLCKHIFLTASGRPLKPHNPLPRTRLSAAAFHLLRIAKEKGEGCASCLFYQYEQSRGCLARQSAARSICKDLDHTPPSHRFGHLPVKTHLILTRFSPSLFPLTVVRYSSLHPLFCRLFSAPRIACCPVPLFDNPSHNYYNHSDFCLLQLSLFGNRLLARCFPTLFLTSETDPSFFSPRQQHSPITVSPVPRHTCTSKTCLARTPRTPRTPRTL